MAKLKEGVIGLARIAFPRARLTVAGRTRHRSRNAGLQSSDPDERDVIHHRGHPNLPVSSAPNLPIGRRFEHDRDVATSAGWTHQPQLQARERKARSPRANQRVEIELLSIDAPPHRHRAFTMALGAANVHPPAEAPRHA